MKKLLLIAIFITIIYASFTSSVVKIEPSNYTINYTTIVQNIYMGGMLPVSPWLYNDTINIYFNTTLANDTYVNVDGDTMTGNLNMGNNNITNFNTLQFNITTCADIDNLVEGTLCWDQDQRTLNVVRGNGQIFQVGKELGDDGINKAGEELDDGTLVCMNGFQGDNPTFVKANATNSYTSSFCGILTGGAEAGQKCQSNDLCPVTVFGFVNGVDTSSWVTGQFLYSDPDAPGNLTTDMPLPWNDQHVYGIVGRISSTVGTIFASKFINQNNGFLINNIYATGNVNITNNLTVGGNFQTTNGFEDDLQFPINVIKLKGVSVPEEDFYTLNFDKNAVENCYVTYQTPHDRKVGSNFYPHFHWQTSDNTTGDVVWCISVSGANIDDDFTAFMDYCIVDSSVSNLNTHLISPEIYINGENFTESSIGKIKIYRNATDSRDTYDNDARLIEFDIHYYRDKLGYEVV